VDYVQRTIDLAGRNVQDGGRKYFELSTFYDEFAKPWQERRLPMCHEPRDGAVDVYRLWQDHDGGDRRVPGTPSAAR
jgi:hypothetical protein